MTIRVLIADDQGIVRAGLSTILNGQPGLEVVGQAADGRTAVALATFATRGPASTPAQPVDALTDREEDVLAEVALGRTNAEIARDLHISMSTVKFHLTGLMTKLGARNRVELAIWAYQTHRVT
ncbi:hypothetical protein GCM10010112_65340 [Actinoplanes lobatus]|uniref:DNA-binding NarL/FixJ family response regulator n=1 Tax=Actinoplanes lobatus TaxID=113568 RepID=A0A7W7HK57_9ACTN|nr:response regulator transcription factor [Actinoplanes lobatus]MBB4751989.1 DNA-binding NarL/FixJ family response regulator [Actinoplanes lobatus]GGN85183.1 hypothetical protein GCM10010112_65340 [Actinoplanes lobatus]GIE45319.1 hypothetical protein Alo02nite_82170 [Actinoplanes lobatus]